MGYKILSFLKIQLGKNVPVIEELKKIPIVKEIYAITGEYDLAIMLESNTEEEMNDYYLNVLDSIDGIDTSNSHLVTKQVLHRRD